MLYRSSRVDKIDLLFMIDNSASMADKQQILAEAVPDLVERLVSPRCINAVGTTQPPDGAGKCAAGFSREFAPVSDIHIGVITSSLGGHGADVCTDTPVSGYNPRMEDMSHLIDRSDASGGKVQTWNGKGFLSWDPQAKHNPPGDSNLNDLIGKFAKIVVGTGQDGCGFEASLESWYRFLVDPAPYSKMVKYDCDSNAPAADGQCRGPEGIDQTVLAQRADFVRPDSLLAVVMLTDENDCSIIDGWQNYIAVQAYTGQNPFHLPRATSQCQSDPAGPQCLSCAQMADPSDPECSKGLYYSDVEDSLNLRCYRQKQRFGIDFMYPIRRYSNALTKRQFSAADVQYPVNPGFAPDKDLNPLFCPQYATKGDGSVDMSQCKTTLRDPRLVFLAAVVGVPWQDIARDPNDLKRGYRPVEELSWPRSKFDSFNQGKDPSQQKTVPPGVEGSVTVWDQILGKVMTASNSKDDGQIDFSPAGEPLDPLMKESVDPRSGINPATGKSLVDKNAGAPTANPINGHEWDIKGHNDLQYACIFRLPMPKDCAANTASCDCSEADGLNNPLCQSDNGAYGKTQYRAKAYPGRRHLAVLHAIDPSQAIAASICPANTDNKASEDYGYRPAIGAIIERLRSALSGTCWSLKLEYAQDGTVPCIVLEATKYDAGSSTCTPCEQLAGRRTPAQAAVDALTKDLNYQGNGMQCVCEIPGASPGPELTACIDSTEDAPQVDGKTVDGWCYVDPSARATANANLVLTCPSDARRMIRFVGAGVPQAGALTFIQCSSSSF
ncbi:MAG: hypothetical protein HY898_06425 [Deltaproteobacteria bacterium]|nr:hypothetical protein [Deltaproteobacteria bacterium]